MVNFSVCHIFTWSVLFVAVLTVLLVCIDLICILSSSVSFLLSLSVVLSACLGEISVFICKDFGSRHHTAKRYRIIQQLL